MTVNLELKFPPLVLVVLFGTAMWLVNLVLPSINLGLLPRIAGGLAFFSAGVFCVASGVFKFSLSDTTINPIDARSAAKLVTSGLYRFSRNPMYLGFVLILIGWGVSLANVFALLAVVGFVKYLTRFQIEPEERALQDVFGDGYIDYKQRVRRWL